MKQFKIEVEGSTPLIWNRMKPELMEIMSNAKKSELDELEKKNWKMKAEIKNKKLIIPPEWIMGAIINAAKQTKVIPHFATSKNQTYTKYLSSTRVECNGSKYIIAGKESDLTRKFGYYNSRGAMGGGKIAKYHPMLENWKATFIFTDPVGRLEKKELQEIIEWAGSVVGIGDQRKTGFGRFKIKTINEVN